MQHELKIWPCYFEAVKSGEKTFEVRENSDRGFQKGDSIILKEYIPPNASVGGTGYTGRTMAFTAGYVLPLQGSTKVVFSLISEDQT